eukprot:scaffold109923_cov30-Tisochrysis_lutea.AAC.7
MAVGEYPGHRSGILPRTRPRDGASCRSGREEAGMRVVRSRRAAAAAAQAPRSRVARSRGVRRA